jgi:hypothetical protein
MFIKQPHENEIDEQDHLSIREKTPTKKIMQVQLKGGRAFVENLFEENSGQVHQQNGLAIFSHLPFLSFFPLLFFPASNIRTVLALVL